jgi:hypothetical protein
MAIIPQNKDFMKSWTARLRLPDGRETTTTVPAKNYDTAKKLAEAAYSGCRVVNLTENR